MHPHFVNVSVSREGSGKSAHCAGWTEPSSFVNLIKLYQIFMQWPIKCCMKLCRHESDNISDRVLTYSKFGLFYSNILILTPTFQKSPIEKYGKTPYLSGRQHFYSYFQNPSENPAWWSGKQLEYAMHMLAILAENALHVMGFNLFNTIYRGHISPFGILLIWSKFNIFYTHIDARRYSISISVRGSGFRETAWTLLSKRDNFVRHYLYAFIFICGRGLHTPSL